MLDDLKHAQRARLAFLDHCLTWRGAANRADLEQRFGISTAQAALDFRLYIARAPQKPRYDPRLRCYLAAPYHQPMFPADLPQMAEVLGAETALPRPARAPDPSVLAALYQARLRGLALQISYISLQTGADSAQWISPTEFFSDGETLYFRAFSYRHGAFRNYLPSRIAPHSSFAQRPRAALPPDLDWLTEIEIGLRPCAHFSAPQAEVIRREYGFTGAELCVKTRRALEVFFDAAWGIGAAGAKLERARTPGL